MKKVSRYHPVLVTLHWWVAFGVIASLTRSFVWQAHVANSDPAKIGLLRQHMTAGIVLVSLMSVRLLVRLVTAKPAAAPGPTILHRAANIVHFTLYALLFTMAATGLATAYLSGAFRRVFLGGHLPLPPTFRVYPTWQVHVVAGWTLVALIVLHVSAALYHQFIKRDGLFRRMWFGRRVIPEAPNPLPLTYHQ